MKKVWILLFVGVLLSCTYKTENKELLVGEQEQKEQGFEVQKTESEWKELLDPMQFYVLRQKGTERPFTGEYDKFYENGIYQCAACKQALFDSDHKFNSGTGWPSFDQGLNKTAIGVHEDYTLGMSRAEIICSRCGGHLGHVFEDGPTDTGLRYCVNSASLEFVAEEKK